MIEETPITLPIVLEVGDSADNEIRASSAKINIATIYLDSLFRLVSQACSHSIDEDTENTDELLNDIQNVCVIGRAIANGTRNEKGCLGFSI